MKITLLTGRTFDINAEFDFEIKVIKSHNSAKLILRIDKKDRAVILSLPKYCSQKKAISFVKENEKWIKSALEKIPEVRDFAIGDKINIFGTEYIIEQSSTRGGTRLDKENNIFYVSGSVEFVHRRVKDYIKKIALDEFYTRSCKVAQKIEKKVNSVCIKDTKSRWASCSSLNNINYSWRLALAPDFVIDYIVAHEVCHLAHQNHSSNFWELVYKIEYNAAKGRKWLSDNGQSLYLYR